MLHTSWTSPRLPGWCGSCVEGVTREVFMRNVQLLDSVM